LGEEYIYRPKPEWIEDLDIVRDFLKANTDFKFISE
jgi:hypothetical protein